ncbi:MAG: DUF1987 domain-containing protein [Bacteroidota bacterium]|nr:DUF1987 domain-containing protein [Bacteroidota bacterium]
MKNLVIPATKKTPEIIFLASGELLMITGSSFPENVNKFYQPIVDWLEELKKSKPAKINITFDLENVNTSSTRIFLQILRSISEINKDKKSLRIVWKYENEDKDMLEQGETLEKILKRPFEFIEKAS